MTVAGSSTPFLIFGAEACVVTCSTLRIIFLSRGQKILAPLIGFFEISIWLFAISQAMKNLDSPACFLAFALGFTLGNFLGILIEKWLALGTVTVRIITRRDADDLIDQLREARFGVTSINGEGATGPVQIIMTIVKRRQARQVIALIEQFHPQTFYAIDEMQCAAEGVFATQRALPMSLLPAIFSPFPTKAALRCRLKPETNVRAAS